MRILLVLPNFDAPLGVSVGLSYLAACLRRAGHEVSALHIRDELGRPWDLAAHLREIAERAPGLVGVGSGFNHYPEMQQLVTAIETQLGIPCVLGGIHATLNSREVMEQTPALSFLNVGEGEASLVELADALQAGADTTAIANVHARRDGVVHVNPPRPFLDLSELPDMDTEIWEFQRITDLRRGWINVSAQRGCPYRCTYCHNNGEAILYAKDRGLTTTNNAQLGFLRHRPVDAMLAELAGLRDRYEMHAFSFIDDTFTMSPDWLAPFLEGYAREVAVPFVCNTTAVDVNDEILDQLAAAGCRLVRMGVESGSDRLRSDLMNRPFTTDRIRWAFDAVQERGMHALAFNMIGNVGETREESLETFRFNARLKPTSLKLSLAHPYPGTEYDDAARAVDAVDPDKHIHNFIDDSVLRRDADQALWLDKVRTFYFWYVNRELGNEASAPYARLVEELEALDAAAWEDADVKADLWARHTALSDDLQARRVMHYTAPFPERPDLTVSGLAVADQRELILRQSVEPH